MSASAFAIVFEYAQSRQCAVDGRSNRAAGSYARGSTFGRAMVLRIKRPAEGECDGTRDSIEGCRYGSKEETLDATKRRTGQRCL
jgi:hypothetical protein